METRRGTAVVPVAARIGTGGAWLDATWRSCLAIGGGKSRMKRRRVHPVDTNKSGPWSSFGHGAGGVARAALGGAVECAAAQSDRYGYC